MSKSTHSGAMIMAFVVTFFFMSFSDVPVSNHVKEFITSTGDEVLALKMPEVAGFGGFMDTLYVDIPTFLRRAPRKRKLFLSIL